jgi:hypothetical protein
MAGSPTVYRFKKSAGSWCYANIIDRQHNLWYQNKGLACHLQYPDSQNPSAVHERISADKVSVEKLSVQGSGFPPVSCHPNSAPFLSVASSESAVSPARRHITYDLALCFVYCCDEAKLCLCRTKPLTGPLPPRSGVGWRPTDGRKPYRRTASFSWHHSVRTVHRPGDDPRKECEECSLLSNVKTFSPQRLLITD